MRLISLLFFLAVAVQAQYVQILGTDTLSSSRTQLNRKPASQTGVGAPTGACTSGLDYYINSTNQALYGCVASSWVLLAGAAGITYTATATIDIAAVPDGTCRLDSTAVTVTGAALGGRPTIGASFQPPEGIHLSVKVTGPNSMKVEICNWSGASYDPASATYYFGVTQ